MQIMAERKMRYAYMQYLTTNFIFQLLFRHKWLLQGHHMERVL